ncbi:MAG: hypothetical protein LBG77_01060 [Dysgonamonadaceae bacterium]|nr:hypothetical protein [Dysgonamonadaceae bacterium]
MGKIFITAMLIILSGNYVQSKVIFFEVFESSPTTAPYALPAGWTNIPTSGGNGWTTDKLSKSGVTMVGHSGARYMDILGNLTFMVEAFIIPTEAL